MNIGYFNALGNGFGKISGIDHTTRYSELKLFDKFQVCCKDMKNLKKYKNCFEKNQYYIVYQAKIAEKKGLKGKYISGIYKKTSEVVIENMIITISVERIDRAEIPFEFSIDNNNFGWVSYNSNSNYMEGDYPITFPGSVGSILSTGSRSKHYDDIKKHIEHCLYAKRCLENVVIQ